MKILFSVLIMVWVGCKWDYSPYNFDFDEIDHYFNDLQGDDFLPFMHEDANESEQYKVGIYTGNIPETLMDTTKFLNSLIPFGYEKQTINPKFYKAIKQIFKANPETRKHPYDCIPTYRDILVLKKNGKTIGIAKLCFECNKKHIVGAKYNVVNFEWSEGFYELKSILYDK